MAIPPSAIKALVLARQNGTQGEKKVAHARNGMILGRNVDLDIVSCTASEGSSQIYAVMLSLVFSAVQPRSI